MMDDLNYEILTQRTQRRGERKEKTIAGSNLFERCGILLVPCFN